MYESYFGLREPPFSVTPNPRFFFTNSSCREAFATLCYGVEQRKGIVVVTGEAGTGKTTLLKMFMHSASARVHASYILDPHLSFAELLRCTLAVLGLEGAGDRLTITRRFYGYLVEQLTNDHLVVLLLDEAQDISDEVLNELTLLADLENDGAKLLQIVFVGQPEFESKIEQLSFHRLKQRIALRSRLTPLSADEISPYIDFRLTAAGYQGKTIFFNAAVERIAFYSKGIPRLVNVICDNALLIACATSQNVVDAETIEEAADGLQLGARCASPLSFISTATPSRAVEPQAVELHSRHQLAIDFPVAVTSAGCEAKLQPDESRQPCNENLAPDREEPPPAYHPSERRWAGLSAAFVTLIVVLGVVAVFSHRQQDSASLVPVTDHMATLKEIFAPIPERIYRVLLTPASTKDSFDSAALEIRPDFNSERSNEVAPLPATQKQAREADPRKDRKEDHLEAKQNDRAEPSGTARPSSMQRRAADMPVVASSRSRFEVVENSFVRKEPATKAEVVATLRPGTRIQLVGRTGDYLQVVSLEQEAIRGYVHREDAFFKPR